MFPHDGTNGGTPTPRNDSAASVRTAAANTKLAWTITGERQFGRTCRPISVRSEAPNREREGDDRSADQQGQAGAVDHTAEDVATDVVRSEPVGAARGAEPRGDVHVGRVPGDEGPDEPEDQHGR